MDRKRRGQGLGARLTMAYSILIVIVSAAVAISMYREFSAAQRQAIRERLHDIVSFSQPLVDGNVHANILAPQDAQGTEYAAMTALLRRIQYISPVVKHIYTLRQQQDGSIGFVVDGDPDPSTRAGVGDKYQRPSPLLKGGLANLTGPVVESDLYTDESGTFLSGYAPIYDRFQHLDGVLGIDIDASEIINAERRAAQTTVFVFVLTVPLALFLGWLLSSRLTAPIVELVSGANRVARGQLDQPVPVRRGSADLETLAETFNAMQAGLRQSRLQLETHAHTLEQQVAERTRLLERRATQLATGAEIAHVATTLRDPDQLVAQIVQLIQGRFGFYYVGLFLVDEENRFAVLHVGTGKAGRIMKERGHRLEIGDFSMVGWACAHQQARIALDVGQDAVRFANPLLPDTRSEIALPLRVQDPQTGNLRVIGALDVQSIIAAAFDESDIAALQGMADQIAVALENARLFQQTQKAMRDLNETSRLLTQQGWEDYLERAQAVYSAEFRAPEAQPVTSGNGAAVLNVPLELGGQPIGALVMERENGQPWTDEEAQAIRAIAQQATLTLDNARLFEEAQRTAARERLLNEIAARIRGTATLDGVLNSAVREISALTGASFAEIELQVAEIDS